MTQTNLNLNSFSNEQSSVQNSNNSNISEQPSQVHTPERRRGSSFAIASNFFSNLSNTLRNSSSSSNLNSRSRANSGNVRDIYANMNNNNNSNLNSMNHGGSQISINRQSSNPALATPIQNLQNSYSSINDMNNMMAATPTDEHISMELPNQMTSAEAAKTDSDGCYSIRLTPFIDHSSTAPALYFSQILRKTPPNTSLSVGRYTDKMRNAAQALPGSDAPIVFKSKVVSRVHAEFIVDSNGNWFVKDLKSSSGTFLNHMRLSPANLESEPKLIRNGDVLQLGMDFRGGVEDIFRCVKMRVELNKSWLRKATQFNKQAHERLKNLSYNNEGNEPNQNQECAICLLKIKPCQSVFLSPCSHCWHYKCIRQIIVKSYPQFLCPNCRETCDLEADLEESDDEEIEQNLSQEDSGIESNDEIKNVNTIGKSDASGDNSFNDTNENMEVIGTN